jgi:hypothetical protein
MYLAAAGAFFSCMDRTATLSPAGWRSDPSGRHELRYWDGTDWTESVSDGGVQSRDAVDQRATGPVAEPEGLRLRGHPEPSGTLARPRLKGGFFDFWTTLPGVLTAFAAVITAVGGIFIARHASGGGGTPPAPEPQVIVVASDLGVEEIIETGATYSDYTTVSDDSGTIVVDVPVEWAEVNGEPLVLDDGTEIPDVAASTDLGAFFSTYDAPGVEVSATDTSVLDVSTAMVELAPAECSSIGYEPYDDAAFAGEIEFFDDCADTDTVFMLLAASYKAEPERIAIVQAQIVSDADIDAIVRVLETFNFTA